MKLLQWFQNRWTVNQTTILYLRWKDTGILYTEAEARERITFASNLCGGRCAVFDGVGLDERAENYRDWPLRSLVESLAT